MWFGEMSFGEKSLVPFWGKVVWVMVVQGIAMVPFLYTTYKLAPLLCLLLSMTSRIQNNALTRDVTNSSVIIFLEKYHPEFYFQKSNVFTA
jgi:hypothetical protein